jgi:hypothetical protein
MGDFTLSPLEERVLRTLRDSERIFLTIYQLAVELDDHAIGELQSATRLLKRRLLVTEGIDASWAITGIGESHLANLALERARR